MDIKLVDNQIRKALKEKGWSISYLVKKIGLTDNGYQYAIKNNSLKLATLLKIAETLDKPISYFFGEPVGLSQSGTGNVVVNGDIRAGRVQQIINHNYELEKENERLKAELRGCQELLKSKDEIIKLLKEQNKKR